MRFLENRAQRRWFPETVERRLNLRSPWLATKNTPDNPTLLLARTLGEKGLSSIALVEFPDRVHVGGEPVTRIVMKEIMNDPRFQVLDRGYQGNINPLVLQQGANWDPLLNAFHWQEDTKRKITAWALRQYAVKEAAIKPSKGSEISQKGFIDFILVEAERIQDKLPSLSPEDIKQVMRTLVIGYLGLED